MKDELVDILDKHGTKTGESAMKSKAHKLGLWHGGAHIWIYNSKNEVLLQRRAPTKVVWPNIWDVAVAGHIAAGETPLQTLVKEAEEELSIKVESQNLEFINLTSFEDPIPPNNWIHRVFIWSYLLKADLILSELKLEEAETSEVRWIHYEELEAEINDPAMLKQYSPRSKQLFEMAISEIRQRDI